MNLKSKKFVHLRGCMGVGKTSTARSLISRGEFSVEFVMIRKKRFPYTVDKKNGIIITGRYDQNVCGGLDGKIKDKQTMIEYLSVLMKLKNIDLIVFEAVMYGMTFDFGFKLSKLCSLFGYSYIGISLEPSFSQIINNIYQRNENKPINEERIFQSLNRVKASRKKLSACGIEVYVVDPSKYSLDNLCNIVYERI